MATYVPYIGNGAYCYAHSASMLLRSIGEDVSPATIEVLSGVGLGASMDTDKNLLYFNNQSLEPDLGITKVLDVLGFSYDVHVSESPDDFPFEQLKQALDSGAAVLGPLDMGYLNYNPNATYLKGVDHYVLAYDYDGDRIFLHDPAEFPHVFIQKDDLQKAWEAAKVSYKDGFYRYITKPVRNKAVSASELYDAASAYFITLYTEGEQNSDHMLIGGAAITSLAQRVAKKGLTPSEFGHFVYFALPLASKRATDCASFFDQKDSDLAALKREQAAVFGLCHTYAVAKDWPSLSDSFNTLADVEEKFKAALLQKN